jgi:hypothetical protein
MNKLLTKDKKHDIVNQKGLITNEETAGVSEFGD